MNKWDLLFEKGIKYKPLNDLYLEKLFTKIQKILPRKIKPQTITDLGCGTGESILKFLQNGFIATGIDSSSVAITKAHDLIKKENKDATFLVIDLEEMSEINNDKSDVVFCKDTYAFIKDKLNFLNSVKKLMHENSIFILITPVLHNHIQYLKEDKPGIAINFDESYDFLRENFDNVEIFHHDYFGERGDIVTFLATNR